jgi:hypothetical protein
VIRTGGSSQIPLFVQMLETRFGAEKVRSVDVFSSVTAGLGVIAHRIQQGEMDTRVYRCDDYPGHTDLGESGNSVPAVDFDVMKKFIALHAPADEDRDAIGVTALTEEGKLVAAILTRDMLDNGGQTPFESDGLASAISQPADAPLLLCTSEYRFLRKTPRDLTRLRELGLILEDAEGFKRDVFGDEHITGISRYDTLKREELALLVTIYGAFKAYKTDELLPRLEQVTMYTMPRLKGDPLALIPLFANGEVIAFSTSGRATRVRASALTNGDGRLMRLASDDPLIAAFAFRGRADFLMLSESSVTQLSSADVPLNDVNATGIKVRRSLQSVVPFGETTYALTTQHILPVSGAGTLKLNKNERLISLLAPT